MKKILIVLFIPIMFFSCKKYIQQQEENAIVTIMTSGVWFVYSYNQNDTSITSLFSGYTFQFIANGTVLAIKDSATVATGTWVGNISNQTIDANFPGATSPLDQLNTLWTLTDTKPTTVVATATIGSNMEFLELLKQ